MHNDSSQSSLFVPVVMAGVAGWVYLQTGPMVVYGEFQLAPTIAAIFAGLASIRALVELIERTARFIDWRASHKAQGKDGTSMWGKRRDIKPELLKKNHGPFWGRLANERKTVLFVDYASNAMTVSPAGSGKGINTVIPNGLSIHHSKVVPDFKCELTPVLKKALEARGERVYVLNPPGLFENIIGKTEQLSPLDLIVDSLYRPGGLRDIPDDIRELSEQLLPEPNEEESDDTHWREGARRIIGLLMLIEVIVEERHATIPAIALNVENRQAIEDNLRWGVGVDVEGRPLENGPMPIEDLPWTKLHAEEDVTIFIRLIRSRAASLLKLMCASDSKTFDSYLSSAEQALAPYSFGQLGRALGRSTFDINELKNGDKPTTIFIVLDASKPKTADTYAGLMQWYILTTLKRHPNKQAPVYFLLDECTNYKVHGLISLLTWGRGYGIRLHLIFQDLTAFERKYGKSALDTLFSETEIQQFLPGQRSKLALETIRRLLGEQSVMAAALSHKDRQHGLQENLSEAGRPLMTEDEIRRTQNGILIIRQHYPFVIEPVSYAEIHPWREQSDINPYHGKPFLKKVKIRL